MNIIYKLYLCLLLNLFMFYPLYAKNTDEKNNDSSTINNEEQGTILSKEQQQREFEKKLETSLMNIAFSSKILDNTSSMKFLLDNQIESYLPVKNLLTNKEIEDSNLVNIWNIFSYFQSADGIVQLTCQDIESIYQQQSGKIQFQYNIINSQYSQCSDFFNNIIKHNISSTDENIYYSAIKLIKNYHLDVFSSNILEEIKETKNLTKKEQFIILLSELDTKPYHLNLDILIDLLGHRIDSIRNKTAQLFSYYPEYEKKLQIRFKKTNNEQEKSAIISAIKKFSYSLDFLLQAYKNNPAQQTNINRVLVERIQYSQDYYKVFPLFYSLNDTSSMLSILTVIQSLVGQYIQNPSILKEVLLLKEYLMKINKPIFYPHISLLSKEIEKIQEKTV